MEGGTFLKNARCSATELPPPALVHWRGSYPVPHGVATISDPPSLWANSARRRYGRNLEAKRVTSRAHRGVLAADGVRFTRVTEGRSSAIVRAWERKKAKVPASYGAREAQVWGEEARLPDTC